ncbi:OLC1v1024534C1 [Oldenlandia corymbosa var. corymbosa]|uniref:OLC1v1024534C1 n=1 Tax=Oldenlandia corymbosa var. corymbosa TaxID=529605 RepID=A0AAV1C310_OLDCO|nr:OLC1v1024534C1 [Oldenlandia corymbosa var. corymbosa]
MTQTRSRKEIDDQLHRQEQKLTEVSTKLRQQSMDHKASNKELKKQFESKFASTNSQLAEICEQLKILISASQARNSILNNPVIMERLPIQNGHLTQDEQHLSFHQRNQPIYKKLTKARQWKFKKRLKTNRRDRNGLLNQRMNFQYSPENNSGIGSGNEPSFSFFIRSLRKKRLMSNCT